MGQHLFYGVLDPNLITRVGKAPSQRAGQAQMGVHFAQQQRAAIAGESATGKIGDDLERLQSAEQQRLALGGGSDFRF